jgi:hypothetical protein
VASLTRRLSLAVYRRSRTGLQRVSRDGYLMTRRCPLWLTMPLKMMNPSMRITRPVGPSTGARARGGLRPPRVGDSSSSPRRPPRGFPTNLGASRSLINAPVSESFTARMSSASAAASSSSTHVTGDAWGASDHHPLRDHGRCHGSGCVALAPNDSARPRARSGDLHLRHSRPFGPSPVGT